MAIDNTKKRKWFLLFPLRSFAFIKTGSSHYRHSTIGDLITLYGDHSNHVVGDQTNTPPPKKKKKKNQKEKQKQ